ncbi:tail length tape measure protein [Escherichia phage vB_EcoP-ZQ2]|uniref:Tape measure protein n=1 Tax=Escherichia phage vB_EcoP-ZQ2 TaxID=2810370 RepID=A0A8F3C7G9_9CAUD|nr:tail length tape measure protein [Escherichia phage vB_EcoP-ZQ2]QWY13170.1 tape measure protein [Escherichia phage vB_EcoP-ZQ2]
MTTEAATTASDILAMSDDEILNMEAPAIIAEEDTSTQNNPETNGVQTPDEEVDTSAVEDLPTEETFPETEPVEDDSANSLTSDKVDDKVVDTEVDSNGKPITEAEPSTAEPGQEQKEEGKQSEGLPADFNYKEGYEKLMAPFKANGKMITPRSPEEAISLMQMGANYTRKMQELQPYRKVMLMLQNNGLMDEEKLSFLIDLDKKNPEAIKKLLKDSGTDPLDFNPDEEINYQGGKHRVTDTEADFATEIDDLKSTQEGQATLGVISSTWDAASKDALYQNRGLLHTIHEQRENGIYDTIANEVNRLQVLGQIPVGTPFIQAYNYVGNLLAQQGAFNQVAKPEPVQAVKPAVQPVVRVARPKQTLANSEQAKAASLNRAATRKATPIVNPLAMSDEDFAKLPVPGSL